MKKETIDIIYNPRCSKCRSALARLQERERLEIQIREYLKEPLSKEELRELFTKVDPISLIRQKEEASGPWKEKAEKLTEDDILSILAEHPALLERPIVRRGARAIIARPPELLDQLFN